MTKSEIKHPKGYWLGVGISVGVAIGVALGPLFENIGIGIALGIALGSGIGASLERRYLMPRSSPANSASLPWLVAATPPCC